MIGKCPNCNGVNIQKMPYKSSQKEISEVDNPDNDIQPSETTSELSKDIRETSQVSPDNPSEFSENSPEEVKPSENSVEISDIIQAYEMGYVDGSENPCPENEGENPSKEVTPNPGNGEEIEEGEEEEEVQEEEEEGGETGISPLVVIIAIVLIGVVISVFLAAREG